MTIVNETIATEKRKVKRRKRSAEAEIRHRERYQEILQRRRKIAQQKENETSDSSANKRRDGKKLICKYFYRNGTCDHGDSCNFSHDCIPLNSKDIKLCQFYIKSPSQCKFGAEECRYSHDPGRFLCRLNVINGICENKKCLFSHMTAGEIENADDSEKLKFCYNNKQFLINLLISKLKENSTKAQITSTPGRQQLEEITAEMQRQQGTEVPWYLQYVATILERDLELLERED